MDKGDYTIILLLIGISVILLVGIQTVYADEGEESLGFSGWLDDFFEDQKQSTAQSLEECEIEGVGTNQECLDLHNAGFEALQTSKDLAFSYHHFVESAIQFVSPIQIAGAVLGIASAILGLLFFKKIGGRFGKHNLEIFLIFGAIAMIFLVLGNGIDI